MIRKHVRSLGVSPRRGSTGRQKQTANTRDNENYSTNYGNQSTDQRTFAAAARLLFRVTRNRRL
jgi:hypothetical protein